MNNLAAAVATGVIPGQTVGGSCSAAASTRSASTDPARVVSSEPATPAARVQKSERTSPHEGRRIRTTMNRVIQNRAAVTKGKESLHMNTWAETTHFAGLDWAKQHHDVLVLDSTGRIATEFRFEHTAEGWALCRQKLADFPRMAMAVESGHNAAIERLVTLGYRVYPVHPRSSKSYRTRKLPSGTKTDRADCWALADALRLEGEIRLWFPYRELRHLQHCLVPDWNRCFERYSTRTALPRSLDNWRFAAIADNPDSFIKSVMENATRPNPMRTSIKASAAPI